MWWQQLRQSFLWDTRALDTRQQNGLSKHVHWRLKAVMLEQNPWKQLFCRQSSTTVDLNGCSFFLHLLISPKWWVKSLLFISSVICFLSSWRLLIVHNRLLHSCVPMPTIQQYGIHAQWKKAALILNLWRSSAHWGRPSEEEPCCLQSGAAGSS